MWMWWKGEKKKRNVERCLQEEKKSKSVKALNEECKDEHADKKKGSLFPWPRNRSFGKGPKKKDLGEYSECKPMDIVFTAYQVLYRIRFMVCVGDCEHNFLTECRLNKS